jgi:hypothetical protein
MEPVLRLSCAVVGACLVLAARPALANGRFPASNQIVFSPSDPNLIILRTTYGILPSHDNGASWQFLCEDALGLPNSNAPLDPPLGLTQKNALVAGVTNDIRESAAYLGLDVSPDIGCSWNCIGGPLAHQAVSDIVVRPDAPDDVLAVTSTYGVLDAGGASSQVFESTDDGTTWKPVGVPLDPTVVIETIDVVKSDPSRIYLSGTRGIGPQKTALLFVSTDKGMHWAEHPISGFDPTQEEFVWIGAVDPTDPNRVYVRSSAPINPGGLSRLYVTTDSGATFQKALEFQVPPAMVVKSGVGELLGFALSPDGSKIYAGSKEGGLFMAAKSDLNFHMVNSSPHANGQPLHVQCLATRGNELWACSDAVSGFVIGVSTDDGAHFCPKMLQITSITGLVDCSGTSSSSSTTGGCGATVKGSECQSSYDTFCQLNVTPCQADCPASFPAECRGDAGDPRGAACDAGSAPEAGTGGGGSSGGGGGSTTHAASSSCGCSTVGGRTAGGLLALWAGIAIALKRRRRGATRPTSASALLCLLCMASVGSTGCSKAAPEPSSHGMPSLAPFQPPMKLSTSQNLRSVWGSSDSDVWVVGDKGTIEHFAGRGWSDSNSGTTDDLTGIYGTAPNDVWVSTQQGSVLHWDGTRWSLAVAMTETTLLSIWASGPTDVWAVGIATTDGDAGLIRHFNGVKWDTVIVPNSTSAWAVTGMGPNEVWLVGSTQNSVTGFVLRGNGSRFDTVGYGGPSARGIWVIAPNDVWVAPYQGAMMHYDGSTWMASSTTGGPLLRVAGTNSGEVWAVGLGGTVLHYQGGSWSTPSSGTTEVLWSVWSSGMNSSVWAVGNNGTVIRWDGSMWAR